MVINIYGESGCGKTMLIMNLIYSMHQWRLETIQKTATVPYIKQAIINKKINMRTVVYSDQQLKKEAIEYLVSIDFVTILESYKPMKINGVYNLNLNKKE